MKKLTVLLLAAVLLCTCFALAACGDDENTSSTAGTSSTASNAGTSSGAASSAAASKEESSAAASSENVVEASSEPEESSAPETSEDPGKPEAKLFWLTHYNATSEEGFGVIMTEAYSGGDWWFHVAFAPAEGEDGVWQIVELSDGSGGSAHALDIPDGGFVYAVHAGNDNSASGGINYTSKADADMVDEVKTWKVGEKFTFTGIDFENFTEVPTTTPDVNWWEDKSNNENDTDDYVCTATFTKVG